MRHPTHHSDGLLKNIEASKETYALGLSQGAEPTGENGRVSPKRARPKTASGLPGTPAGGRGGCPVGCHETSVFFLREAFHGDVHAQYTLAECFVVGDGHASDLKAARGWYEKAAAQGHVCSSSRLGTILVKGLGGPRDHGKGFSMWQAAATAGDEAAENNTAAFLAALDGTTFV